MPLSLVQLENELLAHLGVDVTDFTNGLTDVDLILNRSWWQVMADLDFKEKETRKSISLVVNQSLYNVTTLVNPLIFEALQNVAIEDPTTFKHSLLELMQPQTYEANLINLTSENAKPTHYVRSNTDLIFWPTPDKTYNVTLYYLQTLADIAAGGPPVPQNWHDIILFGAIYRGFMRFGDYNRGNAAKKHQDKLIENSTPINSKELANLPLAGLSVLGRDY